MSMNGNEVAKVAGRITLDFSPAREQMNQFAADYQAMNDKLISSTARSQGQLVMSEKDAAAQRLLAFMALGKQMELAETETNARIERAKAESDARILRQNELTQQKMYQNEQMYQQRMSQLQNRTASSSGSSLLGGALGNIGKSAMDIAAGLTFYRLLEEMMKIPAIAMEAQASMTKLQQVLELSPNQDDLKRYGSLNGILQQLEQTAGVMAQTYGVDLNVVIDAMSMVGRKFKDVADIVVATDTALQMYAVDNVPVETAVQSLEALMSQFGLNMDQARKALFELTAAAHSFQVTGTDLMTAIERSGSSFATLKMNTAEAIAAISTLAQMTAQSGSTMGNAWKSIEASMMSDKGVKALKDLGIAAYDANGNLKDGVTILQQLQKEWPKLSDAAKIHFAEVLAGGKYQYERLLTFLNDYTGQYQRALNTIKQANQQQQEQLVATALESPTKQLQMTKASFEVLANSIAQNVQPEMIAFLTEIRQGTRYLEDNFQSVQKLLGIGANLAGAYITWKVGLSTYNAVMESTVVTQGRFSLGVATIIGQKFGFGAAMESMGGAALSFGSKIAMTVGRMAAFLALFQVISTTAQRAADPLGAKIGDLQQRINVLDGMIADTKKGNFGAGTAIKGFGTVLGDLFLHGDITRAGKDFDQLVRGGMTPDTSDLLKQRAALETQLKSAQKAKDKQTEDEIKKSLDEVNRLVAEAIKKAQAGLPKGGKDGSGTGNGSGAGSGKGSGKGSGTGTSAGSLTEPFADLSQQDDIAIYQYQQRVDSASASVQKYSDAMELASQRLQANSRDTKALSDYMSANHSQISALRTENHAYSNENAEIHRLLPRVQGDIDQVNAKFAAGKLTAQQHRQELAPLQSEYQRLTGQLNQNNSAISQNNVKMAQLGLDAKNTYGQFMSNRLDDVINRDTDAINKLATAATSAGRNISGFTRDMKNAEMDLSKHPTNSVFAKDVTGDYLKAVGAYNAQNRDLTNQNKASSKEIGDLNGQLKTWQTLLREGKVTEDEYAQEEKKITDQKAQLTDQMNQNTDAIRNNSDAVAQLHIDMKQAFDTALGNLFANQMRVDTDAVNQFKYALTSVNHEINTYNRELSNAENDLARTGNTSAIYTAYNKDMITYRQSTTELTDENAKLTKQIADLNGELTTNAKWLKEGKIDQDTYNKNVDDIHTNIDQLSQSLYQNQEAISSNADAMNQAAQTMADTINKWNFDNAKSAIDGITNQLKDLEQNQIDALDSQISAIDQKLNDMQYQNTADNNQEKLAKLQAEAAKWKDSTSVAGRQKYQDYMQQITDLQKQMNYDSQRHDLETQKQTLEDKKTAIQNHFQTLLDMYQGFSDNFQSINDVLEAARTARAGETDKTIQGYLDSEITKLNTLKNNWINVTPTQTPTAPPVVSTGTSGSTGSTTSTGTTSSHSPTVYTFSDSTGKVVYTGTNYDLGKQIAGGVWVGGQWIPNSWSGGGSSFGGGSMPRPGSGAAYFAKGGQVPMSAGIPGVDSVPAMLTPGEIIAPSWEDLTGLISRVASANAAQPLVVQNNFADAFRGAVFRNRDDIDYASKKIAVEFERATTARMRSQGVRT